MSKAKKNAKLKQAQQQKRKEKELRKQKQKQSRRQRSVSAPAVFNARHRDRIAEQKPVAWSGESASDIAIFDSEVLATISTELQQQVLSVRNALSHVCSSNGGMLATHGSLLAEIPRNSPLSPWRLFGRGLQALLEGDHKSAASNWSRIKPQCRAGRIATVLTASRRDDLQSLSTVTPTISTADPDNASDASGVQSSSRPTQLDKLQIYCAKLTRRVRFDRPAIRAAQLITSAPEEDGYAKDIPVGLEKKLPEAMKAWSKA